MHIGCLIYDRSTARSAEQGRYCQSERG